VLIGVLIGLGLTALLAVHTGQRLADTRQRDNEAELLFVGEQYRQAIMSYWRESPGGVRSWPARLDDLVEDKRFPKPRRHLRKLYADPLSPETPWGLLNQGSAVIGVYSQAPGTPFRQVGFNAKQRGFDSAQRYADWRFLAEVPSPAVAPAKPLPGKTPTPGAAPAPQPTPRGIR
jgi:hypothetical protein